MAQYLHLDSWLISTIVPSLLNLRLGSSRLLLSSSRIIMRSVYQTDGRKNTNLSKEAYSIVLQLLFLISYQSFRSRTILKQAVPNCDLYNFECNFYQILMHSLIQLQLVNEQVPRGYIRCDYFIDTHRTIVYDISG